MGQLGQAMNGDRVATMQIGIDEGAQAPHGLARGLDVGAQLAEQGKIGAKAGRGHDHVCLKQPAVGID